MNNIAPLNLTSKLLKTRGFTLIELMIVVAIIGILAGIAYPSYQDSILKGRRAEGRTALLDLMQQQERYLTQNGSYKNFAATDTVPFKKYSGDNSTVGFYTLTADTCPATDIKLCVALTATPKTTDTKAGNLMLDSTGAKSCNGTEKLTKGVCW